MFVRCARAMKFGKPHVSCNPVYYDNGVGIHFYNSLNLFVFGWESGKWKWKALSLYNAYTCECVNVILPSSYDIHNANHLVEDSWGCPRQIIYMLSAPSSFIFKNHSSSTHYPIVQMKTLAENINILFTYIYFLFFTM